MVNESEYELAIQRCHEAVARDGEWAEGLDRLAWVMGADGCSFVNQGAPETRMLMPASPRYAAFVKDFVSEGWAQDDLRAKRGWPKIKRAGMVLLEHDVSSEDERNSLPVYRDLYSRHDLYWWGAVTFSVRQDFWALAFLRSKSDGPFMAVDAEDLRRLAPLMTGLVQLRLAAAKARAGDLVRLAEQFVGAALMLSDDLDIVSASGRALEILRRENLLAAPNQLAPGLRARLLTSGENPVLISRGSRRPLLIDMLADAPIADIGLVGRQRLVVLRDLEQEIELDPARLRMVFGLTPAEAVLGAHLARGETLQSTSGLLGISVETARNHLRAIFAKTDTHRQPDLVSLMFKVTR